MTNQDSATAPRHPHLLNRSDSAVIVVDVQPRLLAVIPDGDQVVGNIAKLLEGARVLGVPTVATEQYPEKLGNTLEQLSEHLQLPAAAKLRFSMAGCQGVVAELQQLGVTQVVLVGIETHVCVLQSALDLLGAGFDVYVAADAVSSRKEIDREIGLQRMSAQGISLITTEMALFEWCEEAGTDEFRAISTIVRRTP
jgi:nicotinamidase-related amidase